MFVPEAWGHAVLNLAESIGVASEFEWGASEFAVNAPAEEPREETENGDAATEVPPDSANRR